jgi:hypothetical protein
VQRREGVARRAVLAATVACLTWVFVPATRAAVVTTSADNGTGSLRQVIASASPGETITFAMGVNPTLTSGGIGILKPLTLAGNGIGQTTITGAPTGGVFGVLPTPSSGTVMVDDLTITGGHAGSGGGSPGEMGVPGGAIELLAGNLVINRTEFSGNTAGDGAMGFAGPGGGGAGGNGGTGGGGGAIHASGMSTLTISDSIFSNNLAGNGGAGGDGGSSSMTAGGKGGNGGLAGVGGAIATNVQTSIINTTFTGNRAGQGGAGGDGGSGFGGFQGDGGNGGNGGDGGAIYQNPLNPMTITVTLGGSTFNGNVAGPGGGGGASNFGSPGEGGPGGDGGAIIAVTPAIGNSTLTGNQAGAGGSGGSNLFGQARGGDGGNGGGTDGAIGIRSSTIVGNSTGLGGAGGTTGGTGVGGAVNNSNPSGTMVGSIVANNMLGGGPTTDFLANCAGAVPSTNSSNLTFPANTGCTATVGDPLLGTLADNGGPTKTIALGPGSAAIDQLPVGTNCPTTDQRGIARPQGPACDIGAFELEPAAPVPAAQAAQPTIKKKKCKKKKHKRAAAAKKKKCKKKKKKR